MDINTLKAQTEAVCMQNFGCTLADATETEAYRAVCITVRELLVRKNQEVQIASKAWHDEMGYEELTDEDKQRAEERKKGLLYVNGVPCRNVAAQQSFQPRDRG